MLIIDKCLELTDSDLDAHILLSYPEYKELNDRQKELARSHVRRLIKSIQELNTQRNAEVQQLITERWGKFFSQLEPSNQQQLQQIAFWRTVCKEDHLKERRVFVDENCIPTYIQENGHQYVCTGFCQNGPLDFNLMIIEQNDWDLDPNLVYK